MGVWKLVIPGMVTEVRNRLLSIAENVEVETFLDNLRCRSQTSIVITTTAATMSGNVDRLSREQVELSDELLGQCCGGMVGVGVGMKSWCCSCCC